MSKIPDGLIVLLAILLVSFGSIAFASYIKDVAVPETIDVVEVPTRTEELYGECPVEGYSYVVTEWPMVSYEPIPVQAEPETRVRSVNRRELPRYNEFVLVTQDYMNRLVVLDRERVEEGLQPIPRIRERSPEVLERIATDIVNATFNELGYPETLIDEETFMRYVRALVVIGGYESNYTVDAMGDCIVFDNAISRRCEDDEFHEPNNYISCGPTQVISRHAPGFEHRPSCSELTNSPTLGYQYTIRMLSRMHYDHYSQHWNVSGYAGTGPRADRFETKFNNLIKRM